MFGISRDVILTIIGTSFGIYGAFVSYLYWRQKGTPDTTYRVNVHKSAETPRQPHLCCYVSDAGVFCETAGKFRVGKSLSCGPHNVAMQLRYESEVQSMDEANGAALKISDAPRSLAK